MNETSEGMPNPLANSPSETPAPKVAPAPTPVAEPTPAPAEPAKNGKPALVIGIILLVVALIAGIATAIVMLNPFGAKKDAFPAAIAKLFSDDAPKLISADSELNVSFMGEGISDVVSSVNVKSKDSISLKDGENSGTATAKITLAGGDSFSIGTDIVKATDEDFYLKLSGLKDAINSFTGSTAQCDEDDIDCLDVSAEMTSSYDALVEMLENKWLKISTSTLTSLGGMVSPSAANGSMQCLTESTKDVENYREKVAELYKSNEFITYTTENLKIAQKNNQLYRLGIDGEKLASFTNAMYDANILDGMIDCMGVSDKVEKVNADDLKNLLDNLPAIYVEIDGNNNFTRLYVDMSTDVFEMTADISFSYPSSITIEEPGEYTDVDTLIKQLMPAY